MKIIKYDENAMKKKLCQHLRLGSFGKSKNTKTLRDSIALITSIIFLASPHYFSKL